MRAHICVYVFRRLQSFPTAVFVESSKGDSLGVITTKAQLDTLMHSLNRRGPREMLLHAVRGGGGAVLLACVVACCRHQQSSRVLQLPSSGMHPLHGPEERHAWVIARLLTDVLCRVPCCAVPCRQSSSVTLRSCATCGRCPGLWTCGRCPALPNPGRGSGGGSSSSSTGCRRLLLCCQ
jgi:hypothetical protein